MKRPAWAGTESRVRRETTTIVRKDAGTDQAAGWPRSAEVQPDDGDDGQRPGDGSARAQAADQQPGDRADGRQPAPPDPEHQQRREGRGGHRERQADGARDGDVLGGQRQEEGYDDRDRGRDAEGRHPAEPVRAPPPPGHVLRQHPGHRDREARAGGEEGGEGPGGDEAGQHRAHRAAHHQRRQLEHEHVRPAVDERRARRCGRGRRTPAAGRRRCPAARAPRASYDEPRGRRGWCRTARPRAAGPSCRGTSRR